MGHNQPTSDAHEFSQRLNEALDAVDGVPALGHGRGIWLAKMFNVTEATANGWLNGRFKPMPMRVRRLAERIGCDYEWLYFGAERRITRVAESTSHYDAGQSHSVRDEALTIALTLVAEALGRDLYLPPQEHTHLVVTTLSLLDTGLEHGKVRALIRQQAEWLAKKGGDEREGDGHKAAYTHR